MIKSTKWRAHIWASVYTLTNLHTPCPHLPLFHSQTAGWAGRSDHNRPTSPWRACLGQICSSPHLSDSLFPNVLREKKDPQAAAGWRWGRCRPLVLMGGPRGMTWLLFGSHALWHTHVTLLQAYIDDGRREGALSICCADTKTHTSLIAVVQQVWNSVLACPRGKEDDNEDACFISVSAMCRNAPEIF